MAPSPDAGEAPDAAPAVAAPFTATPLDQAHIGSNSALPDFQKATGDVDLSGGPFAAATLVVDLASSCFPFAQWTANPPPTGQNYPATCDAFDRNFETALFAPGGGAPGLELVHAVTPSVGRCISNETSPMS